MSRKIILRIMKTILRIVKIILLIVGLETGLCRAQPKISKKMSRKGAFYIDQLVELCVKCLLQKAVHTPCSLCWLHKWGGL